MRGALQQLIAAEATRQGLAALAAGAPAAAPLSLTLALPDGGHDWLDLLPADAPYWYRARPAHGEYRLAIGHALHVASAGAQRFAALDNARAGLQRAWRVAADGEPPPLFCGFACDPANEQPLPNALLAVPALLLENFGGRCRLTLTAPAGRLRECCARWPWLLRPAGPPTAPTAPTVLRQAASPLEGEAWCARVGAALRAIAAGELAKVVLSRRRQILGDRSFAAAPLLAALNDRQPGCVVYAHGDGRRVFLGATPERLVRLQDGEIAADALAGTAWPGSPGLAEAKNRHEQQLVAAAIRDALSPLCSAPPVVAAASEQPVGRLRHLRSRITGIAQPGTTLFELVGALHPTPAVGGYPAAAARRWQATHGEERAAWYAGGFGLLAADGDGEFSVALRCALLDGRSALLQAGAGIVAGSDPGHELAETDAKLQTLLEALAAGAAARKSARCA